jgi:small subunit ribosomal protein S9
MHLDMIRYNRFLYRCRRPFCSSPKEDDWLGSSSSSKKSIFDDELMDDTPSKKKEETPMVRRPSSLFTAAPQRRHPVVEGTPRISMSQALFLAKEAGVFTTREVQTHLIKSPSFSIDEKSPFLLENFFNDSTSQSEEYSAEMSRNQPGSNPSIALKDTAAEDVAETEKSVDVVPSEIHSFLKSLSSEQVATFGARGREWKVTASGKGTRKRSTAHVVIERGTGIVKVNGEEDFFKRWPLLYNRFDVLFPFEACKASGLFDVYIAVKGGGISGQAGAARLAVGRALVDACSLCEDDLKETLVLYEDTRQKTSKFPGKKGAYSRWNWTLR